MTAQEFTQVLEQFCESIAPGISCQIEVGITHYGRFYGLIVSPAFDHMDMGERQTLLWEFLRKTLSSEKQQQIFSVTIKGTAEKAVEDTIDEMSKRINGLLNEKIY